MIQSRTTPKGFTLIELILYVAIASILLTVISLFLSTVIKSRLKQQSMTEVESQGLQIMEQITRTIRSAETINSPTSGNNSNTLSLGMSNGSQNPTVFESSGSQIQITEGTGSPIALSNGRVNISNLDFKNLSRADTPGLIQVEFDLDHVNNSGRNEYTFSKSFSTSSSLRHP